MFSIPREITRADVGSLTPTFRNPIAAGADPWVVRRDGYYYWCFSESDRSIAVYRSTSLVNRGDKFLVWSAARRGPYSKEVWAPELHWLDGRWYIYVAVSDGRNATHRMVVLESSSEDPTKPFHFKAELYTGDDLVGRTQNRWAIDGTVFEHGGRRYFLWSGWAEDRDEQWLYIAPMANPWTISASRVRVCANDDHLWERVGETWRGRGLHEAPQVLQRNGRVFMVYSCSGSWEPCYKLGMLELAPGGDPLDSRAWHKHSEPVFRSTIATFGVGHCAFVRSPDGTEDWMVFHSKTSRVHGWKRVVHAQRFSWTASGEPDFGAPLSSAVEATRPSGEFVSTRARAWMSARNLIADYWVRDVADKASGTTSTSTY